MCFENFFKLFKYNLPEGIVLQKQSPNIKITIILGLVEGVGYKKKRPWMHNLDSLEVWGED